VVLLPPKVVPQEFFTSSGLYVESDHESCTVGSRDWPRETNGSNAALSHYWQVGVRYRKPEAICSTQSTYLHNAAVAHTDDEAREHEPGSISGEDLKGPLNGNTTVRNGRGSLHKSSCSLCTQYGIEVRDEPEPVTPNIREKQ